MASVHKSLKTGKWVTCKATVVECPLEHADSVEEGEHRDAQKAGLSTFNRKGKTRFTRKLTVFSGAMMMAVSTTGCSSLTIEPEETAQWKHIEQEIKNEQTQKRQQQAEELYDKAKEKASEAQEKLSGTADRVKKTDTYKTVKEKLKTTVDSAKNLHNSNNSNSDGNDNIYFQGRSLIPTAEEVDTARTILANLVTAPEYNDGGYDRKSKEWKFKNSTAHTIEQRDLTDNVTFNTRGRAKGGSSFVDPYTGKQETVIDGSGNDVDLDHIIPLKEVYRSGGNNMSPVVRKKITNDPENLQLVGSSINRFKSDNDPAGFLPPYEPAQCIYAVQYIKVKGKYNLTVDEPEKQALQNTLDSRCNQ